MTTPTIKDVARLARVSPATVSRVLNQKQYCSDEVKRLVEDAVAQTGYKPNSIARSLKNQSTNTIGLVVTDISNPFFAHMAKEIERVLSGYGYNLTICNTDESKQKEQSHLQMLQERRVDGILLCSTGQSNDYIQKLVSSGIKIVLIDREYAELNLDVVKDDNVYGAYMMTSYLIQRGHQRIALLRGNETSNATLERERGYRMALEENHIAVAEDNILSGGASGEYTISVVDEILKRSSPPTAIFALNSLIARHTIMALNINNVSIPKDMALVCFGLEEFKTLYKPAITCVIQRPDMYGYSASNLIVERIKNRSSGSKREIVFPPEIFHGGSV